VKHNTSGHLQRGRLDCMMFHVKPDSSPRDQEPRRLAALLEQAGLRPDAGQVSSLLRHLDLVLDHNSRVNLTRITEYDAALRLHIVDSLAWLPVLGDCEAPIVDVGSGAGFPGVPLAIVGHQPVILCESIRKKADFLTLVCGEIAPTARVHRGRAEELALAEPEAAGTVTARAVASLPALVELASPLLRSGGRLIALKGRLTDDELASGDVASAICGMRRSALVRYTLPEGAEERTAVAYTKVERPSVALPRRPGQAQRTPFGGSV